MESQQSTGSYLSKRPQVLTYIALSGALAVGLGAFGAHALKDALPTDRLAVYQTAVLYHFLHTVVLLAAVQLSPKQSTTNFKNSRLHWAIFSFGLGITIFSGSLYLLATRALIGLESASWLGAITPLGGVALIIGWTLLAFSNSGR